MNASDNPILTFLRSASLVKERELNAVVSSFLFVVVLMSAYYILRPVRDAMASDWS
ncbi:MAG: MFS transporter, partial [Halieaceae bacterium]|nr:MFS transporter [Halieaceae bacterium]